MSSQQKLKANMISSLVLQITVFISGIILPRLFIECYGSRVNGLISSIQQFLGFITLGEMGIGAVIQFNLYKPLSEKNWDEISAIVTSANRFFNKLLKCIVLYILVLAVCLPVKVLDQFSYIYTVTLIISISISYIMQYYFGMTYRQLLDADQISFVRIIPQIVQIIINLIVCVLLIRSNVSIQVVKMITSILYSIQPVVIYIYCKKKYPRVDNKIHLDSEPIKQKWNGIAQHIASVVLKDTDVVVLTLCSTLENVSIYAVYNLVINGIEIIIESVVNNFTAYFGELFAKSKILELKNKFDEFESIYHMILTIIFFCIGRLIVPFVAVYTYGIKDANYIVPVFALILTIAQWLYCARLPYHIIVKAAGHYRETQNSAFIEAILNVSISITTVYVWGIIGVALGTAVAMLYRSVYYWIYLRKNILIRPLKKVLFVYGKDCIIILISYIFTIKMSLQEYTYFSWFILACRVFATTIIVAIVIFLLTNLRRTKVIIERIHQRLKL